MIKTPPFIHSTNLFPVVGIGASAGGLDAFKKLLRAIPEDSGMAYVLVQHLDPNHESMLPEILQKVTTIPVLEISNDIKVEPNHIYVIPSNKMLVASDGVLKLTPRSEKGSSKLNLSIDLFFESIAEIHQTYAIGVVLSGTATDGTKGLKAIKDNGGITFAQEESTAAFESMPHSAVEAGVVDFILPPEQIPQKIIEVIKKIFGNNSEEQRILLQDEEVFKQIISLIQIRKRTDFTYYKQTTIRRRILRRIVLKNKRVAKEYLALLRENNEELDLLYQDLLIPVTSFFRDAKTFENLCESIFPLIIKNKTAGEPIRVWVAGCSTGEEAYSIAICLKEFLGDNQRVQIFATDLSDPAIAKARTGNYSKSDVESISSKRLSEFFININGSFQLIKQVRDMCIFANHNFLKDPPFGKMDLISCRNVLIYMEPYLQKKALTTFHYSLNPKGFLLLGKSETTSGVPDFFALAVKNDKLFSRRETPNRLIQVASQPAEQNINYKNNTIKIENIRTDFQKSADEILLSKYTPAGVVVNELMNIVHFRGGTGNFLEQSPGKPTHNLLQMAKHGLSFELRNILHKVKKEKKTVLKENIPLQVDGSLHNISIEAIPLPNIIEPYYLILFHDSYSSNDKHLSMINETSDSSKSNKDEKDLRIQQLERELDLAREDMRSITEEQEAANEELQSANEELLSGSEELQSLNEELETNKEELQSTNEELTVVNHEIISLNELITESRDYSEAIVATVHTPLIVLNNQLQIKSANQAFYKTFQVNEKETENKLIYDIGNKQWDIPALRILLEKILPEQSKILDYEVSHTFQSIGERIMRLNAHEIKRDEQSNKLILLAIQDITEEIKLENIVKKSNEHFRNILKNLPAAVYSCDLKGRINFYNDAAVKLWGRIPELNKDLWFGTTKIYNPNGILIPIEQSPMALSLKEGIAFTNEEIIIERLDGNRLNVLANPQPEYNIFGERVGSLNILIDITEQVLAKNKNLQNQKDLSNNLEEKIKLRTKELSDANELLLHKNQELESFTFISSHDLQEPLRKIQTFSSRILEKEKLSETGKDYFQRMQSAASRMQTLIDDLLTFSRISTIDRKFELSNLRIIIDEVKNELHETINEKHAILEEFELCDVRIIPFQFRQLLHNIINNSLKFSKTNQPPHIVINSSISLGKNFNNTELLPEVTYSHISITDNGIGFEQHFESRIFEVFQKLHRRDEYAGTGIGLAIVKKVVDNHNGIIDVHSELEKGTTFNIYLPTF